MPEILHNDGKNRKEGRMKTILIACAATLIAAPLYAGAIERACIKSPRQAANRATCSCIQHVADIKLTRADQKQAAKFFAEPQLAQDTRQSSNPSTERFWLRYKAFGYTAAEQCRGRSTS
jgi:hypothetical protein